MKRFHLKADLYFDAEDLTNAFYRLGANFIMLGAGDTEEDVSDIGLRAMTGDISLEAEKERYESVKIATPETDNARVDSDPDPAGR